MAIDRDLLDQFRALVNEIRPAMRFELLRNLSENPALPELIQAIEKLSPGDFDRRSEELREDKNT